MRLVNGVWAAKILGHGGLFRSNGLITVAPKAKEAPYAWFSSPLRRYVIWLIKDCCYLCCLTKTGGGKMAAAGRRF